MPELWVETIAAHRAEVREAILDAAGDLLRRDGLLGLSMSELAAAANIGRATLYKHFPDIAHVVTAWHEREVTAHLTELAALAEQPADSAERLRAVCLAYARICQQRRQHGDAELRAVVHHSRPDSELPSQLVAIFTGLITQAAAAGSVRRDVPQAELAAYCISALDAARDAATPTTLSRLVDIVWAGLTPPPPVGA